MDRVLVRRLAGLVALVFAGMAPSARADAVASGVATPDSPYYFSFGGIGSNSPGSASDPGGIEYVGTSNVLIMPGSFSLGEFVSNSLPQGASLSYANVPFYVDLLVFPQGASNLTSYDGILIQGVLNGTLSGSTLSSVTASITSVQDLGLGTLPFSLANLLIEAPQLISPADANGGLTTLNAYVAPSSSLSLAPVPEPTSVAAFIAVAAAIGLRARRRRAV